MQRVGYLTQIRGSFSRLYQAVPRDRQTLKSLHQDKVGQLKQAGLKKVAQNLGRTMINLILSQPSKHGSPVDVVDLYRSYPFFRYMPDSLAREIGRYLSPPTLPLVLRDNKNQYTCYQLAVNEANHEKIEQAREQVITAMERYGYKGFDRGIDCGYDCEASIFVVENPQGEIVATARMVSRTKESSIPLEDGLRPDGSHHSINGLWDNVLEINSFAYGRGMAKALPLLFSMLGKYAWLGGAARVFCLLDEENKKTSYLYTRAGFSPSAVFLDKISFSTFGRDRERGFEPTTWRIMEMFPGRIMLHGLNSLKFKAL